MPQGQPAAVNFSAPASASAPVILNQVQRDQLWDVLKEKWKLKDSFTDTELNTLKTKLNFNKIENENALNNALKGNAIALSTLVLNHANTALRQAWQSKGLQKQIERLVEIAREKRKSQPNKKNEKTSASSFPATLEQQQHYNGDQTVMLYAIKSLGIIFGVTPLMTASGAFFDARATGYTNWGTAGFGMFCQRFEQQLNEIVSRPPETQNQENEYGEAAANQQARPKNR